MNGGHSQDVSLSDRRFKLFSVAVLLFLQLILCERTTRVFLAETGKKILSSIIIKAQKVRPGDTAGGEYVDTLNERFRPLTLFGFQSPNRFEEVFEEMLFFLEHTEHWENTEVELATRGVTAAFPFPVPCLTSTV